MEKLSPVKISHFEYPTPTQTTRQSRFNHLKNSAFKDSYKKLLIPRMMRSESETKIFNRYNYENYKSLGSKVSSSGIPQNLRLITQGKQKQPFNSHKNIQLVYCQNKIQNFKQFMQSRIQNTLASKQKPARTSISVKRSCAPTARKNSVPHSKRPFRISKGKSVLSSLLKDFGQLQKITSILNSEEDGTQPYISLQALKRKYEFLGHLDNFIFKRLFVGLGLQQVRNDSTIELKTFINFCSLFVVRDATPDQISGFLIIFFFKDGPRQLQKILEVVDRLKGPASIHHKIKDCVANFSDIQQIELKKCQQKLQGISRLVIDLIVDQFV